MNFDPHFREAVEIQLKDNKPFFKEESLALLKDSLKGYYRLIADRIYDYNTPYHLDFDSLKEVIVKILDENEFPILQTRKVATLATIGNEISFPVPTKKDLVFNSKEQIQHNMELKKLHKDCESEFWQDQKNTIGYQNLNNFECFNDIVIPEAQLSKYQNSLQFSYNVDGWRSYIFELLQTTFPEFIFDKDKSSKKVLRFLKPLANGLKFGFEYNVSELVNEIKRGEISLPYYFNLILINDKFKATTPSKDYLSNYHENILSLGVLGNPFFFEPSLSLLTFKSVEMHYDETNPNGFIYKYKRQFIHNPDGTFQIVHPKDYGEKLKKHAFFYMKALRYSSESYLEYVEKSILGVANS